MPSYLPSFALVVGTRMCSILAHACLPTVVRHSDWWMPLQNNNGRLIIILGGVINGGCTENNVNDVFVFSQAVQQHVQQSKNALQLLRERQWYRNVRKRSFFTQTFKFLRFRVSVAEVTPEPARVQAIRTWPYLSALAQLFRSFWALLHTASIPSLGSHNCSINGLAK